MTQDMKQKTTLVSEGPPNLIRLIKKYHILTGFSADMIFGGYIYMGRVYP